MIRVAVVCQGLRTGGGVPAAARWLHESLRALPDFDADLHDLATSSRDPASRALRDPSTWWRPTLRQSIDGEATHWGANAVELEPMRYMPRAELTAVLRSYDLVHVVAGGPALAYVTKRIGRPTVLQMATFARLERESILASWNRLARLRGHAMTAATARIEARAIRLASVVLVMNDVMLTAVRRLGQHRVRKAPPGVDTDRFHPRPEGRARSGHLLSVCRLGEPRKGLDRTVLAYDELVRRHADAPPLVLAGKGSLTPQVRRMIVDLGLQDRISVRNDVAGDELPELYRQASVFLQSSYEEGFGLASIEAMASGLPVIATETAGAVEVVADGVTGWLIPQGPGVDVPTRLASRVEEAMSAGDDMGTAGRHRAETQFSTRATLRALTECYHGLLGR